MRHLRHHAAAVLAALAFGVTPVAAYAELQAAPTGKAACPTPQQFLPGGDGRLGPGFNTPGDDDATTALGWSMLEASEARLRAEALLASAPPDCMLNGEALRDALARGGRMPLPRLAETPACQPWRQTLRRAALRPVPLDAAAAGGG